MVGAGIGGLAAAVALGRAGANVRVYERASELGEVGQGLGLFANAVRALDALGVGAEVRAAGWRIARADTFDRAGRRLIGIDTAAHERRTGVPSLLIRRPDLHRILLSALPRAQVVTGAALAAVNPGEAGAPAEIRLESGERLEADLVVGADGWRSKVRAGLWGPTPERDSRLVCWRGVASDVDLERPHELPVIQGAGPQFGIGPLGPRSAYWFASVPVEMGDPGPDPSATRRWLETLYERFPFGAARLIAATAAEGILRTPLLDRPPLARWSRGRATLLGDAAHPMTPTLGQGAATALEDAVVLAGALRRASGVLPALAAYEAERGPRTRAIVGAAWSLARLSRWRGPLAVAARDLSLRLTPGALMAGRVERQLGYDALEAAARTG